MPEQRDKKKCLVTTFPVDAPTKSLNVVVVLFELLSMSVKLYSWVCNSKFIGGYFLDKR